MEALDLGSTRCFFRIGSWTEKVMDSDSSLNDGTRSDANVDASDIDLRLDELLIDGSLYAFQEKTNDDAYVILNSCYDPSCISTRRPLLDDYKKGKKTTRAMVCSLLCGGMFKKILSQGEALKIVSYMKIVL
ncbi:hypothetical protein Tco_1162401 [Tanacetum coccineum]